MMIMMIIIQKGARVVYDWRGFAIGNNNSLIMKNNHDDENNRERIAASMTGKGLQWV